MSKFCPKHGDPKELPHMVNHCTCDFPINLIGELVAVRVNPAPTEAVLLPDWKRSLSGVILAVGPCADLSPGYLVSFGAAVGMDSVLNGQDIRILKATDVDFLYNSVPKCKTCENYVESGEDSCTDCLDEQA